MITLIENVKMLDEHGAFHENSTLLFNQESILFCFYAGLEKDLSPQTKVSSENNRDIWQNNDFLAALGEQKIDRRIDGQGKWLMPGMIDAHCHLGLFDDGLVFEGDDGNEDTDPLTPQMRALDGIYHQDRCFEEALAGGITTVNTGPGSANVFSGSFAILKTQGRCVEEMLINDYAAMKAALGENPKSNHGQGKGRMPITRMATAALVRETLTEAVWYAEQRRSKPRETQPDLRFEALLPVLNGSIPLKFHAHRADDILTAVRLADEFGLRYSLDHCTEGYLILDLLREIWQKGQNDSLAGTGRKHRSKLEGVICGPLLTDRSKPELKRAELSNPGILAKAGLPVAIMTDHPVIPIQYLPVSAAMAVKAGMDEEQALRSITSVAADLCDIGSERGRLKRGYQADLILLNAHPFDFRSIVEEVWLQGQSVYHV